jgi:transcriptional regulator with XRE-family HTH domain
MPRTKEGDYEEFSNRLKVLMKLKNIKNNNQLAKLLNKKPSQTEKWVKGMRIPTLYSDWKLLSDFFGKSLDYLIFGKDEKQHEKVIRLEVEEVLFNQLEGGKEQRLATRRLEDRLIILLLSRLLKARINDCERS